MWPAVIAALAMVGAASIGAVGGYATARHRSETERRKQLRELAVEIARLELQQRPDSPYSPAEYVAVLTQLLNKLDVDLEDGDLNGIAVEEFRAAFCANCGAYLDVDRTPGTRACRQCGWQFSDRTDT